LVAATLKPGDFALMSFRALCEFISGSRGARTGADDRGGNGITRRGLPTFHLREFALELGDVPALEFGERRWAASFTSRPSDDR
jgi:hypothetical protein